MPPAFTLDFTRRLRTVVGRTKASLWFVLSPPDLMLVLVFIVLLCCCFVFVCFVFVGPNVISFFPLMDSERKSRFRKNLKIFLAVERRRRS